ncbi:MAG: hypothetical protein QXH73_02225 [Ignisphaera sp.]
MDREERTVKVKARASSGLSGFFVPHITGSLETTGAAGGGLGIDSAITVEISLEALDRSQGSVALLNIINGVEVNSCLARYIVEKILSISEEKSNRIIIKQSISVPIGGGYGTSGGSAVAISFALAKALNVPLDFYTITEIAHEADIVCKTGLGTVVGIMKPCNGITIVRKPGGPRYAEIMCIPIDDSLLALTAFYKPIPKNTILTNLEDLEKVRAIGLETLRKIELNPTPETFIDNCYRFAIESKIMTPTVRNTIELLNKVEGVIGASMNMIGEALFALIDKNVVDNAVEAVMTTNPKWVYIWRPNNNGIDIEVIKHSEQHDEFRAI